MLEGTDLMSAYQPMSGESMFDDAMAGNAVKEVQKQPQVPQQLAAREDPSTVNMYNKQFETDQKLALLVSELKKKSAVTAEPVDKPSYFDRLFGKKKEVYRILQLALIITLGISFHFLIDFYLNKYITDNEMSFERQLLIRLMYPLAVLFLLWNLRVFVR
jgi:hypothetical protein